MGVLRWWNQLRRSRKKPDPEAQHYAVQPRTRADAHMTANESVYAAVARVSKTLATTPLHLYRGGEIQWTSPLERLVAYAPNERMTGYQWREAMQACKSNTGNAYSIIRRGDDGVSPVSLDICDPNRVITIWLRETDAIWYRVSHEGEGEPEWIPEADMIALHGLSGNGQVGISPQQVLRGTLQYDDRVKEYSLKQMDGVNSTVVITVPNTGLSQERQKAIVDEFRAVYQASNGSALVMQGGMTASTLKHDPWDAQVAEIEKLTKNRIATAFAIPPHLLGDYSDTSYATAEQDMQEFLMLTMAAEYAQWEAQLNRKLLTWQMMRDGYSYQHDYRALQRADTAATAEKHSKAIRGGWMTPNEARREDGLPPLPGGDELLVAKDLVPLRVALEQTAANIGNGNGGNK